VGIPHREKVSLSAKFRAAGLIKFWSYFINP
jgi:hypothetical protein